MSERITASDASPTAPNGKGTNTTNGGSVTLSLRIATSLKSMTTKTRNKWRAVKGQGDIPTAKEAFKGGNLSLKGKFFSIGKDQALRYDETYKSLMGYITDHFNHRVYAAVNNKDPSIGLGLLTKSTDPKKPHPIDTTKQVLDKDP